MIEVRIKKDGLQISGHARYAPAGQDIVCAGISALVQTLISSIEDLTADSIEYEVSIGTVDMEYKNLSEKARTLMDSFFIGVYLIADEYPDYVRVINGQAWNPHKATT